MPSSFEEQDYVESDDLEEILEYSAQVHEGSSVTMDNWNGHPNQAQLDELNRKLAEKELDLKEVNDNIEKLQTQKEKLLHDAEQLKRALRDLKAKSSSSKGKGKAQTLINYTEDTFDWDKALRGWMKKVFDIQDFRHCQKGVCNANMDNRDIVCVMPTGGGKSLTYQLPALLTAGVTLVISPLLALINDQVLHLRELGIEAVMITGETPTSDKKEITRRLWNLVNRESGDGKEIKLCYVTPEKLAKDSAFVGLLTKLAEAGRLARFVIDEAHCVSQLGHDFRPDYKELHRLRQRFERVPIMAVSATCPPQVLQDLVQILRLRPIVDGNEADADGTVYFSSPLYRKNLHYKIFPKAASAAPTYKAMADWILEHHPNGTGIIYCFSQKDCETVADEVNKASGNKIRTGVYHAKIGASEKLKLHNDWRAGKVKVVCATIAFGLGIDKGDVRFVLHYTIPKSVDGYYQESGRAGRDGKDSDCVLYYCPQDVTSVAALVSQESTGLVKLHEVLKFVDNIEECRKIQFAEYFRHSANMSISSWSTAETDALQRCGHCDNCVRPSSSIHTVDVTLQAWKIIKLMQAIENMGGKATLAMLTELCRRKKGGKIDIKSGRGRRATKQTQELDLVSICGGPVDISGADTERLIIRLLVDSYLREQFVATAYSTNVYLVRGPMSPVILQRSQEDIIQGGGRRIKMAFLKPETKARKKDTTTKDSNKSTVNSKKAKDAIMNAKSSKSRQTQIYEYSQSQARKESEYESDADEFIEGLDEVFSEEDDEEFFAPPQRQLPPPKGASRRLPSSSPPIKRTGTASSSARKRSFPASSSTQQEVIEVSSTDDRFVEDSEDDGWVVNQRGKRPPRKKARTSNSPKTIIQGMNGKKTGLDGDDSDVMLVSSS